MQRRTRCWEQCDGRKNGSWEAWEEGEEAREESKDALAATRLVVHTVIKPSSGDSMAALRQTPTKQLLGTDSSAAVRQLHAGAIPGGMRIRNVEDAICFSRRECHARLMRLSGPGPQRRANLTTTSHSQDLVAWRSFQILASVLFFAPLFVAAHCYLLSSPFRVCCRETDSTQSGKTGVPSIDVLASEKSS